jgi:DNA ligase-1
MAWEVRFENGVWLPQIGWWLDARYPVAKSFVSHAHFDHVAAHQVFLCSEGTARLTRARLPGEPREIVLPFGQPHALTPECEVTLHPAGHIYGSAQFHARLPDHGSLLYTGDFKLRRGLSAEPCATPRADVVIMETTFGLPRYVFPPTEQVVAEIVGFCQQALHDDAVPVLFGYSLGKSQEILQALGRAGLPVMLHPEVLRMTQVYEGLGMNFPPYRLFDAFECAGHVVLCPPQAAGSSFLRKIEHRRTAMITGWAMDPGAQFRYQCDAAFPLSDHADFADLLAFVARVQPQRVFTLHGFAREFAQTLRERGVEAWALGMDNQLELGVSVLTPGTVAPTASAPPSPCAQAESPAAADSLARFAAVAETVRATASKLEKIAALQEYFRSLDLPSARLAAVYFTGRPFPQADARTLNVGWSLLQRAVLHTAQASEADYRAAYGRFRDSGETTEALLARRPASSASLPLVEIDRALARLAAERAPAAKLERLQALFACLAAREAKFFVKIVTGDLRIGLKEGLVEEAVAAATDRPVEAVREANLLCGDLGEVLAAARENRLADIGLQPFRPLQFMLASPEPTAGAILARLGPPVWLEEKYDGIRCQIHKVGTRVELYSRDLHRITDQFPDLARAAASVGCDFIADGELLAWRKGRALPFAELQKRLGRKGDDFFLGEEIPVSLSLYDLLWVDGHSLLKHPLCERRGHLEAIIPAAHESVMVAPVTQATTELEIETAFLRARQRGNEGLMAKDPASTYSPGRRGLAWLKLKKAYATLDVVVVGVEYGHGKRRDVLSDYTFAIRDDQSDRLLTVGKAYSGLTDAEIEQLTAHFLDHTREVHGRFRTVEPNVVLEIAFDSIQPSARHQSGYALRFPRIARIRTDKTPAQIDTLATCRKLAGVEPAAV